MLEDDDGIADPEAKVNFIRCILRCWWQKYKIFNEIKEPKKSFREKLAEIQEICLKVQEALDYIASLGERIVK